MRSLIGMSDARALSFMVRSFPVRPSRRDFERQRPLPGRSRSLPIAKRRDNTLGRRAKITGIAFSPFNVGGRTPLAGYKRPLVAAAATSNGASLRVLQKCGFVVERVRLSPASDRFAEREEAVLVLR